MSRDLDYANVGGRELVAEPKEPRVGVWRRATTNALMHMRQHFGEREASEDEFSFGPGSAVRLADGQIFRYETSETPWLSPSTATVDGWVRRSDDSVVVMEDGRDRSTKGEFLYTVPVAREVQPDELRATDRDWLR